VASAGLLVGLCAVSGDAVIAGVRRGERKVVAYANRMLKAVPCMGGIGTSDHRAKIDAPRGEWPQQQTF
jgi:hypothetical protein